MMSRIPIELGKLGKMEADREVMRVAIIAELDAINLYEQLAAQTSNVDIRKVLMDVALEEKTHYGEFHEMLVRLDDEQVRELEKGKNEVRELINETLDDKDNV